MRLLHVVSLQFTEFGDEDRPRYVAASHRWGDDEAKYQDFQDRCYPNSKGDQKVLAFAKYVRDNLSPIEWLWIDTCCINKENPAELSETINLMFEWYRTADICLAHLADVDTAGDMDSFAKSQWFKRGWTLQELLAPRTVIFVTQDWQVIGHKGGFLHHTCKPLIGPDLGEAIALRTKIPHRMLKDYYADLGLSVDDKLRWIEGRTTTRPEDMSYALYGILGVTLGANYGEKYNGARQRLLAALRHRTGQSERRAKVSRDIIRWLSPPDPWTNHESARRRHEPETGVWLLRCDHFLKWKEGLIRNLWVYGKVGCGKTVLSSTAIEDIRAHCRDRPNAACIVFYFSFSDSKKQTFNDLIRCLIFQLRWTDAGLARLRTLHDPPDRKHPGQNEIFKVLLILIASYDEVFLHLDGLDECSEDDETRQIVLEGVEKLLKSAPNVRLLLTSRDEGDIRHAMVRLGSALLPIQARHVSSDIQRYIETTMSRDRKLSALDPTIKTLVEKTLLHRADGMFRWVHCQLQELKKSKSTKPDIVKAALFAMPSSLDETYGRMLERVQQDDRPEALTLLRWLAYARSPLTLEELAETTIIDISDKTADGFVNIGNRGGWQDTLAILAGFIVVQHHGGIGHHADSRPESMAAFESYTSAGALENIVQPGVRLEAEVEPVVEYPGEELLNASGNFSYLIDHGRSDWKDSTVRLAHSSIKEYLESPRVLKTTAKSFSFDSSREHDLLTQSCVVYLMHYSSSPDKTSTKRDLTTFPLLKYASESWYYHASLQGHSTAREVRFLTSERIRGDWLLVHDPERNWFAPFEARFMIGGTALYLASLLGLGPLVRELLNAGANTTAACGSFGSPLGAASARGHSEIARWLIAAGADVNFSTPDTLTALQLAAERGCEQTVQLLLDAGAEIHPRTQAYRGEALHVASMSGNEKIVQILLDAGARPDEPGRFATNTLLDASRKGHHEVVRLLLDAGVNVDEHSKDSGRSTALEAASEAGHEKVVQMLLSAGADVNARCGFWKHETSALLVASSKGHKNVVRMLLAAGADVNVRMFNYSRRHATASRTALQAAYQHDHREVAQMLRDAGAEV